MRKILDPEGKLVSLIFKGLRRAKMKNTIFSPRSKKLNATNLTVIAITIKEKFARKLL